MEELIITITLILCKGDNKDYKLKDEVVSCVDYYVNCIVNNKGDLDKCKDKDE